MIGANWEYPEASYEKETVFGKNMWIIRRDCFILSGMIEGFQRRSGAK